MDSQRQKKVSTLIKKDIAKIIDSVLRNRAFRGVLVSVTNVKTTPDLGQCKVFLSVFPSKKTTDITAFVKPDMAKPITTPAAAFIDLSKSLFKKNSPEIAPIIAPKIIPSGGKNSPIIIPIEAPIIPNLLAPKFFDV